MTERLLRPLARLSSPNDKVEAFTAAVERARELFGISE